jgi:hypothetical protein
MPALAVCRARAFITSGQESTAYAKASVKVFQFRQPGPNKYTSALIAISNSPEALDDKTLPCYRGSWCLAVRVMVGNSDNLNVARYSGFLPEPQFGPANDFLLRYKANRCGKGKKPSRARGRIVRAFVFALYQIRLLTAARGVHAGKGQKVDHTKTLWCSIVSWQSW